jgi:hypothetical protein
MQQGLRRRTTRHRHTYMQYCEVMAMSLIYNPWVIEDGDAEEAAAENDGRTYMAHPHDKEACRSRRKCVGCNTITHLICSGCSTTQANPAPTQ